MIDHGEAKAPVRLREYNLKNKLSSFYASRLESKLARSFVDDLDIKRITRCVRRSNFRPGQRDDEDSCTLGTMLNFV